MNSTLNEQKDKIIYQTLSEALQTYSKMYCCECGGRYSEDNIYICRNCGRTWGYCCVPANRECTRCAGDIR